MNLVKETLNEMMEGEDNSIVLNQIKNVLKNTQALLDLLNTGAYLSPEEGSKLAVVDANIQDMKNRVENEATDVPADEVTDLEYSGEHPFKSDIPDEKIDLPASDIEGEGEVDLDDDELPPPFPEDEVDDTVEFADTDGDGDGDVEVINVETRYEDEK